MTWARVLGAVVLCTAVAALFGTLRERDAGPGALLQHRGDYDGGGKMAKGLGAQAHDLGWDGGNAAGEHGITYSQLPVQRGGEISVYRRDFDADMRRWFPASSARALPPPPPPPAEAVVRPQERNVYAQTGGILPAINTGLQVAWDNLAMTSSAHGCDAACLKDIYRRAFRSHTTPPQQREAPAPPPTYSAEQRDKDLFGQAPAATDVSPSTFSEAYQDVTSVGVPAAPAMLGALSRYLPQVTTCCSMYAGHAQKLIQRSPVGASHPSCHSPNTPYEKNMVSATGCVGRAATCPGHSAAQARTRQLGRLQKAPHAKTQSGRGAPLPISIQAQAH